MCLREEESKCIEELWDKLHNDELDMVSPDTTCLPHSHTAAAWNVILKIPGNQSRLGTVACSEEGFLPSPHAISPSLNVLNTPSTAPKLCKLLLAEAVLVRANEVGSRQETLLHHITVLS